jgi:hypothetical protein
MKPRRTLLLLAACACLCVYPMAAIGHPAAQENGALIKAFDNWIHVQLPAACFTSTVSTVNPNWAVLKPTSNSTNVTCKAVILKLGVGRYLLHRTGGRWKVWAGTSSSGRGVCTPVSKHTGGGGSTLVLPQAVAKNLKLC